MPFDDEAQRTTTHQLGYLNSTLSEEQAAAFHAMMIALGHNADTVGKGRVVTVDYKTGVQTGNPNPDPTAGDPYAGIGPHTVPVYDKNGKLLGYTRPTGIYPKSMFDKNGALKRPGTPGSENPLSMGHGNLGGITAETLAPGAMWPAPDGYSDQGQPVGHEGGINPTDAAGVSDYAPGQKYGPFLANPGIDPMESGQASYSTYSGHAMDPQPAGRLGNAPAKNGPARAEL